MRASDFVLVLPAMYVALALRSVLPLVLAAGRRSSSLLAVIFAVVGAPFVARGVRAIVRTERQLDYARRGACRSAPATRALLVRHLLPAAARLPRRRDHACSCRRSSWRRRRCRTSASDFPIRSRAGARCCTTRRTIRAFADFPWLLSPAAAMFLVVLGAEPAAAGRGVRAARRPPARTIAPDEPARRLRARPDAVRRVTIASTWRRLRAAFARWLRAPLGGLRRARIERRGGAARRRRERSRDRARRATLVPRGRPFIVGTGRESTPATIRADAARRGARRRRRARADAGVLQVADDDRRRSSATTRRWPTRRRSRCFSTTSPRSPA